ncbi:MAG: SDR family oxidoreductase [Magnetococcales bacterium]|nr:SDR family oxidoreductase [Magnetococcales bacterium]
MELQGHNVLITGGARRVGAAIARHLAAKGASLALHCNRSREEAQALAGELIRPGVRVVVVQADLTRTDQVMALPALAAAELGPLSVLINNASIFEPGELASTSLEQWQRHLQVNLTAPFLLMQAFAARLPPALPDIPLRGRIINILDRSVVRPRAGYAAYSVSKEALWSLTRLAAKEWGPAIAVNAVGPGPVLPPEGGSEEAFQRLGRRLPLGRTGSPDAVAEAVAFLLSQDFLTGNLLLVDGGEHLL